MGERYAVTAAFEDLLMPEIEKALKRGEEVHKTEWLEHIDGNMSDFENVKHVIDIHVQERLLMALSRLDYGDFDGFVERLGTAVGYIANAVNKADYLYNQLGSFVDDDFEDDIPF